MDDLAKQLMHATVSIDGDFDVGCNIRDAVVERLDLAGWNYDMSKAPKDAKIIAAGNGGVVTISKWVGKEGRWNMFTKDVPPLAWVLWPDHPQNG